MVTENDRFAKHLGKVFDPNKSKVLILGTLPPYGRDWYYQENTLFWEILGEALNSPELSRANTTNRKKKEILINNGIALWDIFECAWRRGGKTGDEFIIFNKDLKANKIYDEIISKGKINYIIINGLEQALMWFIQFNQEEEIKKMISSGKVISLHQTKWIQSYKSEDPKYKLNWINTIRKALGQPVSSEVKSAKTVTTSEKRVGTVKKTTEKKAVVKKAETSAPEPKKIQKIAFVVKKNKNV